MKAYQGPPTGCTGRDLERLDDLTPEGTVEQMFPADSDGNRTLHGNNIAETMSRMPNGVLAPMAGGPEVASDRKGKK